MIVSTSIDMTGVSVVIDSDGDQGDGYSTDVIADMAKQAVENAITLWVAREDSLEAEAE